MASIGAKEYEARLRLGGEPSLGLSFYWKVDRDGWSSKPIGRMHAFTTREGCRMRSLCGRAHRDSLYQLEGLAPPAPMACSLCLLLLEKQDALR